MKQALLTTMVLLAFPAAAEAKGILGITLCGPSGCEEARLDSSRHRDFGVEAETALPTPRPSAFYRLHFGVEGHIDRSHAIFYEPRSGLVAMESGVARWMKWYRLEPAAAELAKRLARRLEPFPPPSVTEVRIGKRVVQEDAASYLGLHRLRGTYVLGHGRPVGIRLVSRVESPWTDGGLLYFPDNDVLLMGASSVRVPPNLAADIEAARPLGAGDGSSRFPWIPVAVAIAGAAVLALRGALRRGRPERIPSPSA